MFSDAYAAIEEAEFLVNRDKIDIAICDLDGKNLVVLPYDVAVDTRAKILEVVRCG